MERPSAVTEGVRVSVRVSYSDEHSDPAQGQWFYVYQIRISNEGAKRVQLISRHWVIQDALGETREVRGAGVVGQQPVLEPGESFEYTSGCPLETPFGSMHGRYQMIDGGGRKFEVEIPPFALRRPESVN